MHADHFITAVCSKLGKIKKPPKKETFARSFSDVNVEKFREALSGISWHSVTELDSTDDAADCFIEIFGTLFDLYFPLLRKKINKNLYQLMVGCHMTFSYLDKSILS